MLPYQLKPFVRLVSAIAVIALFASTPAIARASYSSASHRYYRSSDGNMVYGPTGATIRLTGT